jgi:hypothetical protein
MFLMSTRALIARSASAFAIFLRRVAAIGKRRNTGEKKQENRGVG